MIKYDNGAFLGLTRVRLYSTLTSTVYFCTGEVSVNSQEERAC
jgi:hypothetical protein